MTEPFVYDKADWHYGADDFSADLDESHGFPRTGMFLGWILDRSLYDAALTQQVLKGVQP